MSDLLRDRYLTTLEVRQVLPYPPHGLTRELRRRGIVPIGSECTTAHGGAVLIWRTADILPLIPIYSASPAERRRNGTIQWGIQYRKQRRSACAGT
jgi:hypothetical protein